ncbi:MAG TPA: hypothetical protein PLF40_09645 [Kofleriaceae bacterium]|nr:hypothetical protein [Kofleriaceae bacterium]
MNDFRQLQLSRSTTRATRLGAWLAGIASTIALTSSAPVAFADAPMVPHADPAAAFASLRGLKGVWTLSADGKKLGTKMTYDEASKGGAVTELFGRELSVFSRDGNNLMMTHFCNSGSVPRLVLAPSSTEKRLQFDIVDVANLPSLTASHVFRVVYEWVSPKRIELDIVWHPANAAAGEGEQHERYVMTKK